MRVRNPEQVNFNPRIQRRIRPGSFASWLFSSTISILASHAGRDTHSETQICRPTHFNPHIQRGMRQADIRSLSGRASFQSSHPTRDVTTAKDLAQLIISILTSHAGCNSTRRGSHQSRPSHFNPRIPHGMRLCRYRRSAHRAGNFNPRIPHGMRHGVAARLGLVV